jgi:hypothetical protein
VAGGGGLAASDRGVFLLHNGAVDEIDPDTMEVVGSRPYTAQGVPTVLFEGADAGPLSIEETYSHGDEVVFLASGGGQPGATFFRVDVSTGEILARTAVPGGLGAGAYDLRSTGPDEFWAYASTTNPSLLRIDGGGDVDTVLQLPPRGELDADLTISGGHIIISDVDVDNQPVVYLIDPDEGELIATVTELD